MVFFEPLLSLIWYHTRQNEGEKNKSIIWPTSTTQPAPPSAGPAIPRQPFQRRVSPEGPQYWFRCFAQRKNTPIRWAKDFSFEAPLPNINARRFILPSLFWKNLLINFNDFFAANLFGLLSVEIWSSRFRAFPLLLPCYCGSNLAKANQYSIAAHIWSAQSTQNHSKVLNSCWVYQNWCCRKIKGLARNIQILFITQIASNYKWIDVIEI